MLFALKVDVDTFRGMREGLPRMLELFRERRILASIFVSMGPDHSGRAIRRIVTKPGFLKKMLRTKAVSLYGPKTILYGTLLPGPRIAAGNADLFRRIEAEGHEAGVHGWDHVRWQDGLPKFDEDTIGRELSRAFETFERIAGHPTRATAAPGWIVTGRSLAVQDRLGLAYSSDVRGEFPFLPRIAGRTFRTPQIATTLPTLDELIGSTDEPDINARLVAEAHRQALARPEAPVVHTVHTEVEGLSRAGLFAELLDRLLAEGARFERLIDVASRFAPPENKAMAAVAQENPLQNNGEGLQPRQRGVIATRPPQSVEGAGGSSPVTPDDRIPLPVCEVGDRTLPGRSGTLACQIVER